MTIADVFIIESLTSGDETSHHYEGQRLAELLRLSGKNPKYFYFQSKDELPHLLKLFELSDYRYLHISCHASSNIVATTKENLSYADFATIFKGYLKSRRVFFSACELGNELFTECLAGTNNGMYSVVAPAEEIDFDHAAAIWAAFYVSAFAKNPNSMSGTDIRQRIENLCALFPVDFHVSIYQSKLKTWRHTKITKTSLQSNGANIK
ncbi:CHAT domain-containing protein [Paraburkholderia tropica]